MSGGTKGHADLANAQATVPMPHVLRTPNQRARPRSHAATAGWDYGEIQRV
jgi:hypothetical protein